MLKLYIILFLSLSSIVKAQNIDVALLETIENTKDIQFVSRDHLGDFYLVKNNQITKKTADKSYNYSNLLYGEISSIDIRNPLQILVYYKNFQSFVILDNQLNEIQNTNLSVHFPELDVAFVSASIKNSYWIYDAISQKILLFDIGRNVLKNVSVSLEKSFTFWNSNANSFFYVADNNLFVYDIYGKLTHTEITQPFEKLILIEPTIFIVQNQSNLYYNNTISKQNLKINLPQKSFNSFEYSNEILTIFTDTEIYIYKLKIP